MTKISILALCTLGSLFLSCESTTSNQPTFGSISNIEFHGTKPDSNHISHYSIKFDYTTNLIEEAYVHVDVNNSIGNNSYGVGQLKYLLDKSEGSIDTTFTSWVSFTIEEMGGENYILNVAIDGLTEEGKYGNIDVFKEVQLE